MRLLVVLIVGVAVPALAQTIYTWVDEEGTTHFTDNPASVPKGTRAQTTDGEPINYVRAIDASEDELDRAATGERERAKAKAQQQASEAQQADQGTAAQQAAAAQTRLAEALTAEAKRREEDRWRNAFVEARERISRLEEQITLDQQRLEPDGLPLGPSYFCTSGPLQPPRHPPGRSVAISGGGQVGPGAAVGASGSVWTGWTLPPPMYGSPCWYQPNPEVERIRDRLARNQAELERAKQALTDLERRAAFEAVPLEWRR